MFITDREGMLAALEILGAHSCCYSSTGRGWANSFCDCKYGLDAGTRAGGEQTGCPELRLLFEIIGNLSEAQWQALALSHGA